MILEAQMAADPGFQRRLYAESSRWLQQQPEIDPTAAPLLRAMALLVQPEEQIPASAAAIRARVAGTAEKKELADVIAAILVTRFNGRSIQEICAMGGITLEEFSQSVAYREIFGQGRQEGELDLALRLLRRRCGQLSAEQEALIRSLSLPQLEALADALLDFQGADDLNAWLAAH